jgi:hypothetical protein
VCLLRGTDWIFMCFVWIWEQTAIIIYVFCVDMRTNSDYFPIQHSLTDCYNRDGVCLPRGTDWVFMYNSTFCPHSVFMCFVCVSEQTAIISLHNINWLVCITETECVYCAVRTEYEVFTYRLFFFGATAQLGPYAASLLMSLHHSQLDTPSWTPLYDWSARRRSR